jgi:hypothetical protein
MLKNRPASQSFRFHPWEIERTILTNLALEICIRKGQSHQRPEFDAHILQTVRKLHAVTATSSFRIRRLLMRNDDCVEKDGIVRRLPRYRRPSTFHTLCLNSAQAPEHLVHTVCASCYFSLMRVSTSTAANCTAWAILIGLIGVAFVLVIVLGPFGLILLGLLTLFICTSVQLREDTPTWGVEVFKARTASQVPPEQQAAMAEEKARSLAPLRFYRWCGVALLVTGIAGFAWQQVRWL